MPPININPFYYAKYLLEGEHNIGEAINVLKTHFKTKYGVPLCSFYYQNNNDDIIEYTTYQRNEYRIYNIFSLLDYIINNPQKLILNYGLVFQELFSYAPNFDVYRLLNFVDLRNFVNLNDTFSYQQHIECDDYIIDSFRKAHFEEGWLVFNGSDFEPMGYDPSFCGRINIDSGSFLFDYSEEKTLDIFNRFWDIHIVEKENSIYEDPLLFWEHQLRKNPDKVATEFLYTLFGNYDHNHDTLVYRLLNIHDYEHFILASKKSLSWLLDVGNDEQLSYFPKYAGYSQVVDGRKWIETLLKVIDGEVPLINLGVRCSQSI